MSKVEELIKEFDIPVIPSEQWVRKIFDEKVDYQLISSSSAAEGGLPLLAIGPDKLENLETMVEKFMSAIKNSKKKERVFYINEKPRVIGQLDGEGTKIIIYIHGAWK